MAHVVGVPKRDPCQKCALPVFLAERLTIGKRVYHRTCLKCARCSSQLTPGSFYETEVDGEYCCETCPDEEKSISDAAVIGIGDSAKETSPSASASSAARGSIASRLAFFENDGKKLLQKSLSDEEKSQSLKKMTDSQMRGVYKHNSALSHFMSNHLSDTADGTSSATDQSNESSRRNSGSTITSTTSDMDDDQSADHQVPDLPTSLPPAMTTSATDKTSSTTPNSSTHNPKTYESTLTLSFDTVNSRSLETSTPIAKEPTEQVASDNVERIAEAKNQETEEKLITTSILSTEKSTTDLNLNDKINVTKDISDTDEKMRTTTNLTNTTAATTPTIATKSTNLTETVDKFDEISQNNRSSMVRARLHQFEIISNNTSPSTSNSSSSCSKNNFSSKAINNVSDEKLSSASTIVDTNIEPKPLETEVPKIVTKDNEVDDSPKDNSNSKTEKEDASYRHDNEENESQLLQEEEDETDKSITSIAKRSLSNANLTEEYPEDLNPFKSDEENNEVERQPEEIDMNAQKKIEDKTEEKLRKIENRKSLNPFDSSDEENEETDNDLAKKIKPPRPPPPKISTNPFGSDGEEDSESLNETPRRMPVPTPRSHISTSQNATPEPTPRLSRQQYGTQLNSDEYYGSHSSLTTHALHASTEYLKRGGEARESSHSIGSSTGSLSSGKYKKAKKAPAPPKPPHTTIKELFPPSPISDRKISPASSVASTPQPRKKRPAPAPPSSVEKVADTIVIEAVSPIIPVHQSSALSSPSETDDVKVAEDKLSDEEKLKESSAAVTSDISYDSDSKTTRRLITVDASLLDDTFSSIESRPKEEDSVVYRRTIAPLILDTSTEEEKVTESHDRQLEKLKDNKEAKNRNRQSQISLPSPNEENDPLFNKSVHGKWKRRKGPAPALPVPPKKVLQMLPLQEIRHELEIIEVQQQGLEKQGVMLEKMIRERCEGDIVEELKEENPANNPVINSKEVEDLILQLFELVNEKNELFRRQAELMYLRRQHRLEQEQADLEYEIRVLMAQPERNKTDSDKAREETMIARLVEVVQLRNEVIDCLEMDRLREAEEDMSIKQRLEMHTAKRDEELCKQTPTKLSKKEKKRQKESKKLGKSKKLDADKDADESELSVERKEKKKKKNLLSSVISFK